jgi:NTE family protein
MNQYLRITFIIISIVLGGCSAHYPVNEPLENIDRTEGYRSTTFKAVTDSSDTLTVSLAFSGGGTRAAAFSYGVLEALREADIHWEGQNRRIIDEVDIISSVSGGSFTAAYFGLFGERIFKDYAEKFLYVNVEGHLKSSLFKPWTWTLLGSPYYGRSELAANYYDEILFEGKTFSDILDSQGPIININATEVATSTQFTFNQGIFDLICSDLSTFPVSRAVAASSAVPVLFSSITLNNYAGNCNYTYTKWAEEALNDPDKTSRGHHVATQYAKYRDSKTFPYLHLYDGGLTDNLGVRRLINQVAIGGDIWTVLKNNGGENIKRGLVIIVNARAKNKTSYSRLANSIPLIDTITGATSIPLNEYSFESLQTVKRIFKDFDENVARARCADWASTGRDTTGCDDVKTYIVVVDIDHLDDVERRDRLLSLPTSFVLKPEEVDDLRQAAKEILSQSREYQNFIKDMQ